MKAATVPVLCSLLALLACKSGLPTSPNATAGDADAGRNGSAGAPDATDSDAALEGPNTEVLLGADRTGVSRLTPRQYDNSVADLLGTSLRPAVKHALTTSALGGYELGNINVQGAEAEDLIYAAEELSAEAVQNLPKLLECDVETSGEDACASAFIARFARLAYRGSAPAEEVEQLTALYNSDKAKFGFEKAIQSVLEHILLSPRFLYHIDPEIDLDGKLASGSRASVTGFGMASRLSYFLWGSLPDSALLDAAAQGALSSEEQIETAAKRLSADPKFVRGLSGFIEQWLELARLKSQAHEVPRLLATSLRAFTQEALASDSLTKLLTSSVVYRPDSDGTGLVREEAAAARRYGLLTQPGLMAMLAHNEGTAPYKRALFVWEQILCEDLPPALADIPLPSADIPPELGVRETLTLRTAGGECISCHVRLNPVGFAFEGYGPEGELRTVDDKGVEVDTATEIVLSPGLDGPVSGAVELSRRIAASDVPYSCLAKQLYRSVVHRLETGDERALLKAMGAEIRANDGSFRTAVLNTVTTPGFRTRQFQGAE